MLDPKTGKTRVRYVDINTESYAVALEYMIRLRRVDLEDPEQLRMLSKTAQMTPEAFRKKFGYLVGLEE
jgi:6-phosphofructokinase 1